MTRPLFVVIALALASCGEPGSRLLREAREAAEVRGVELQDAREVVGRQERAVCARGLIYRESAKRLVLQAEVPPEAWATLRLNWCGEAANDGAALPLPEPRTGSRPS